MTDENKNPEEELSEELKESIRNWLADDMLSDAKDRLRFQHEFTLSGFKALLLTNGAAVISLLTYIGNSQSSFDILSLRMSFISYIFGLALTVVGYLLAYSSQGIFMTSTFQFSIRLRTTPPDQDVEQDDRLNKQGNRIIAITIVLCFLSLGCFIFGSWQAMKAIS